MDTDFATAMRRATDLVRAGDTAGATTLIQSSLGGDTPTRPVKKPKRSLRDTLAGLRRSGPSTAQPPLPAGASFGTGTYACAAGQRDYRLYIPNLNGARPAGLIVMLHGCTQSPQDFAAGTGMNRLAEAHGLILAYPAQARGANMQSCWNWFNPADQARLGGEPEILSGLARFVCDSHDVPRDKVFVAGLSAGAAMAVILGQTHSDTFHAIGAHSGLAYGAAHDVGSAFAAMGGGGQSHAQGTTVPTILFHGTADTTVAPINSTRIAQSVTAHGTEIHDEASVNSRNYTRRTVLSETGAPMLEHWHIDGLGHAWSGGQPEGSYTDPAGPDASAEMVRFFLNIPPNAPSNATKGA